jgi:mono/diheme cytochrome c family protein
MRILLAAVVGSLAICSAAVAQDVGDPRAGWAFAREVCASCHAIERGELRSPAAGAPSFTRIARVPGMTATALTVALRTSHRTMPNLMLDPADHGNVVAYILSLQDGE